MSLINLLGIAFFLHGWLRLSGRFRWNSPKSSCGRCCTSQRRVAGHKANLRGWCSLADSSINGRTAGGAEQAAEQRIDGAGGLIEAHDRGNGALARLTSLVALELDELHIAAGTGLGDLDEHASKDTLKIQTMPTP